MRDPHRHRAASRRLYDPRLQRRAHLSVADPAAGRGRDLQDRRRQRAQRAARGHLYDRHAAVPRWRLSHSLCVDARAGWTAVQSGRAVGRRPGSVVQHRGQLHHQHQLAELRRRKHDVLPRADARSDASELSVGGDRHRARHGADPRFRPAFGAHGGQFLGRYHALHAVHPHSDLRALCAVPDLAGHAADARRLRRCDDAGRRQADHRGRPGRLADRHQDARHQRRRLLQRQCLASVRESDRLVELRADDLDLCDRRGADQRVRPHGRQPAPRLGHPRRHGRSLHRRRRRLLLGRGARQRRAQRPRPDRRQHGRQGSPFRHRRLGLVRRHHHRRLLRRGERHARFLHRARRHGPADQHSAWRGHRRRRRRRHVRHAAVRHHFDLRRRPDGGPHARIRRQEDRSQGSEDGDARHSRPAADVSRLDRGGDAGAVRRRRR